jgi:hypothetical protein
MCPRQLIRNDAPLERDADALVGILLEGGSSHAMAESNPKPCRSHHIAAAVRPPPPRGGARGGGGGGRARGGGRTHLTAHVALNPAELS